MRKAVPGIQPAALTLIQEAHPEGTGQLLLVQRRPAFVSGGKTDAESIQFAEESQ